MGICLTPVASGIQLRPSVALWNNFPLEFYGGGEIVALQLIQGLRHGGFQVSYLADAEFAVRSRVQESEIRSQTSGVAYERRPFQMYRSFLPASMFRALPPIPELERYSANLVFLDRPPPTRFLRELARSPAVHHTALLLHGIAIEPLKFAPLSLLPYHLYLRAMCGALRGLPGRIQCVTLTTSTREFLVAHGLPARNVRVIPNGIDASGYTVGRNDTSFDVLFIGRLERRTKGLDLLREIIRATASARATTVRFHIVGSGPDASMLQNLEDRDRVFVHGFVSESEKRQILAQSNAQLVCSRVEPFGLVVLEGLAAGLPIITTPAVGPAQVISGMEGAGSVLPPKSREFVARLQVLRAAWQADPAGYYARKLDRSRRAREKYSAAAMQMGYLELARELVSHVTAAS